MKRRNFIKKLGFAAGAPIAFHGVPIQLMGSNKPFQRLVAQSTNDNVLIILQMHGGNDGLNTFIPLSNYDQYYSRRANVAIPYKQGNRTAIPLDSTVADADQVGLHPDMHDFKTMYDEGKAAVFQGVSYENNNGSHFRGRDIWFMGGDADQYLDSGWIGRYLNQEYAPLQYPDEFPNDDMPDPLAIEMGNDVSLLFHQSGNIPTSLTIPARNLQDFADDLNELEGFGETDVDPKGIPPGFLDSSPYWNEMQWLLGLEDKSEVYINRLAEVYNNADESPVEYPTQYPFGGFSNSSLADQLRLIARLLEGGVKTKVFLVKIGGFDTHANQVEDYNTTFGGHAALLYHISSAMRAFNNDLIKRGQDHRVLTMTMSEFGRRVASNGSYGTDHGTGGPIMMWGAGVNPGIYGTNPDLTNSNVNMQFDYRQIYANLLHEWMGIDQQVIADEIFFRDFINGPDPNGGNYEPIELIKDTITGTSDFLKAKYKIESVYPNPASKYTQVNLFVNDYQTVRVELIDMNGRVIISNQRQVSPGKHTFSFQLDRVLPGMYFVKAKSEKLNDTKRLFIRK